MDKAEFITEQLKPYILDPSSCGYNSDTESCEYLTSDGRMCVLGKNLLKPESFDSDKSAECILTDAYKDVLKPLAKKANLTIDTWSGMQRIHDRIADHSTSHTLRLCDIDSMIQEVRLIEKAEKISLRRLIELIENLYESLNK